MFLNYRLDYGMNNDDARSQVVDFFAGELGVHEEQTATEA